MLNDTTRPSYPGDPLPAWIKEIRPWQVDAVNEIVDAFDSGADVVFLDAPVGSGKTLIGELVRREMEIRHAVYICSDKALQDQFVSDFEYAKLLKGRSNYPTLNGGTSITCDDCTYEGGESGCMWCDEVHNCPYRVAKEQAKNANVAVLNTAMFMALSNHTKDFRRNEFVIVDEADLLESALISFTEFMVAEWIGRKIGLEYPKKGVHKPTLVNWLGDAAAKARQYARDHQHALDVKQRGSIRSFADDADRVKVALQADIDSADDQSGSWIREYDRVRTLKLLPVLVDRFGVKNLWQHGKKWLLMSGTIISADEMADSLGLPLDYETVVVDSPFPVENRPIVLAPVANVTKKGGDAEIDKLARAIEQIADRHDGRILIHTVSYHLARELAKRCDLVGRNVVTYDDSRGKHDALDSYLAVPGSILLAPSMSRGVDLAGDACEVQVIAKCPFPSLGDKRVAARLNLPGGQLWYSTQTVRDIVQMTGRGVRHAEDRCTTYILDQQFARNVWGKNKRLFPRYFRDAVDERADIRWMLGTERPQTPRRSA